MDFPAMEEYLAYRGDSWVKPDHDSVRVNQNNPELLVEAAGRVCYQSWKNPANKTTSEYIKSSIIEHAHGSVLEHVWLNFMVADLPRSTQLELVRHGDGTAFSFESTRFTDRHMRFILPPRYRGDDEATAAWIESIRTSYMTYQTLVSEMDASDGKGTLSRKRRKEAARAVLPNSQGSDGMFSCNLRSFRWITHVRSDPSADSSIREFAEALYLAGSSTLLGTVQDAGVLYDEEDRSYISFANPKV